MSGNKSWLADLERGEQERTGIRSLKVRYTNNFGYYIEVTKANLHLVPADYVRRQTTVGGERYVTDALRQKEREILHAEDNALAREKEILEQPDRRRPHRVAAPSSRTAEALAEVDVLAGWAGLARDWGYCRPEIDEGDALEIAEGRHPVVEQGFRSGEGGLAGGQAFVPNDTALACDEAQIALITGPTWPASRPTSARSRSSSSWPRWARGCPRPLLPLRAGRPDFLPGRAPATTSRGAIRPSWSR